MSVTDLLLTPVAPGGYGSRLWEGQRTGDPNYNSWHQHRGHFGINKSTSDDFLLIILLIFILFFIYFCYCFI